MSATLKFKLQDSHRACERLRIVGSYKEALLEKTQYIRLLVCLHLNFISH